MDIIGIPILTFITFFPLVGIIILLLLPGTKSTALKLTANIITALNF